MSIHDDMLARGVQGVVGIQGRAITLNSKNERGDTEKSTVVDEATVTGRGEQGWHDEEGRYYSRTIDVIIPKAALQFVTPIELDTLTYLGIEWTIVSLRPTGGSFLIVATRPERTEVHGGDYRRRRRLSGEGTT